MTSLPVALAISRVARRKRVNGVPIGTIRAGDLIPHAECELLQLAHVLMRPPDGSAQLRHGLGDVRRDFADAPGQNVEVVVLVEFEAAKSLSPWKAAAARPCLIRCPAGGRWEV